MTPITLSHEIQGPCESVLFREVGARLFERLDYLKIEPNTILHMGSGLEEGSKQLKRRYPKAMIVSVDPAWSVCQIVKNRQSWFRQWPLVCADIKHLPFLKGTFDLMMVHQVFSNVEGLKSVLSQLASCLSFSGVLMFSMLGPDTYQEILREAPVLHDQAWLDMHDVGDMLMQTGFLDPVLDRSVLTAQYSNLEGLLRALAYENKPSFLENLSTSSYFDSLVSNIKKRIMSSSVFPLTYEVIYGHAWRSQTIQGETLIPLHAIQRKKSTRDQ